MGGQGGRLPLLLLSFAVLNLTLGTNLTKVTVSLTPPTSLTPTETMMLLPTTTSSTAATVPPSRPETSIPQMLTDAFKASTGMPRGISPAASSITAGKGNPETSVLELWGALRVVPVGRASASACLDMAWWRAGLPLRLLLLLLSVASLTVPDLMTETTVTDVTTTVSPTLPTSVTPLESSELLPTTAATVSPSEPETGASTPENSSMSPVTGSASSPSAPAPTDPSAEPSITPYNSTADPDTSTEVPGSTPDISTVGPTPDTSTAPETPSTTTGTEPSSPTTDSSSETTTCACTTPAPNISASHLFLSLRLTVPLDLGNATVQELVLSKLREKLQTAFPCAGLVLK